MDVHIWISDTEQSIELLHRQECDVLVLQDVVGVDIPGVSVEVVVECSGHGGGLGSVDDIHQLSRRLIVIILSPSPCDGPPKQQAQQLVQGPDQQLGNL